MRDYRPIALIHSIGKLFSKVVAKRLAPKIQELVDSDQSAFIRGRSIHNIFRYVQTTTKRLHARRVPKLLLKIDIAKAFDSIAWTFLLRLLSHMGFPHNWIQWTTILLFSASMRIMMNGAPGQRICHARVLRKGNPLSLLLFILVMGVLSSLIHQADRWNLFDAMGIRDSPHKASLYADDLVIFVSPVQRDLDITRKIIEIFEKASGLACNLQKCQIVPIRCTEEDISRAINLFPASISAFPVKYLGVPLSVTKLPKSAI